MNALIPSTELTFDLIAAQLAETGYCILPHFLPTELTMLLHQRVMNLDDNDFQRAGIGREQDFQINHRVRLDETRWLNIDNDIDAAFIRLMSSFRLAINQRLFMGLFDYEAHYAHYAPGAFYKKHFDAFKGENHRVLSTVLYLNQNWQSTDGGELLIYATDTETLIETVQPNFGTFVIFLSERFPHEVVKATRDRYSIAGWFRLHDPLQAPIV